MKQARKYGIEELLPYSVKKTEVRLAKKVEFGSRVKGTGVGQRVKGHKHERDLNKKYVCCTTLCAVARGAKPLRKKASWADLMTQDGSTERSYAQHASTHQGMESGMLGTNLYTQALVLANSLHRSEERTGRSGPTKGQGYVDGRLLYIYVCFKYNKASSMGAEPPFSHLGRT